MNDQFERAPVTQSNGSKVTHVPRGQTTDADDSASATIEASTSHGSS